MTPFHIKHGQLQRIFVLVLFSETKTECTSEGDQRGWHTGTVYFDRNWRGKKRRKRDQKGAGEGDVDRKKSGSLISDTVLLGYGRSSLLLQRIDLHVLVLFSETKMGWASKETKTGWAGKAVKGNRNAERNSGKKRAVDIYRGWGWDQRGKDDKKDVGEGHETGYRPITLISKTVSLGYGSLPLTVTVSVETHLQSKSFLSSLLQAGIPFQVPCQSFASRGLMDVYRIPCRFDSLIFPV